MRQRVIAEVGEVRARTEMNEAIAELRRLEVPSYQAGASLWEWFTEANIEEIAKVGGAAGPALAGMIRVFLIGILSRGR